MSGPFGQRLVSEGRRLLSVGFATMFVAPLHKHMDRHSISVDHIDPRWEEGRSYQLICGLNCPSNLLEVRLSYNAAKQNKFVPYRVDVFPAPTKFGDTGEFLINSQWVVCEFGGSEWMKEAKTIGCGSTQNRVWQNDPEFHMECSLRGFAGRLPSLGYSFGTNGCHTPERQSARIKGKLVWWNPVLKQHQRSAECPGEGWERGFNPERNLNHCLGRKRYHNPYTGEKKVLHEPPDNTWLPGWP